MGDEGKLIGVSELVESEHHLPYEVDMIAPAYAVAKQDRDARAQVNGKRVDQFHENSCDPDVGAKDQSHKPYY